MAHKFDAVRTSVEAMQYTGDNFDEIKKWAGDRANFVEPEDRDDDPDVEMELMSSAHSNWVGLHKFDWVVLKNDQWMRVNDKTFNENYIENMDDDSNLIAHAKTELKLVGLSEESKDEADQWMYKNIMAIVSLFASQGHSGFSASMVTSTISDLLKYDPLTPLTGEDDEWQDISDVTGSPLWQNKRSSRVFKGADGRAYDIHGKVFKEPNGDTYTNSESHVFVEFPYKPKTEYVQVEA